jgi:hypothetical protein
MSSSPHNPGQPVLASRIAAYTIRKTAAARARAAGKAENLIVVTHRLPSSTCRQEVARLLTAWLSIFSLLLAAFVVAACSRDHRQSSQSAVATGTNVAGVRSDAATALLTQGDMPPGWALGDLRELVGRGSNFICGSPVPPEDALAEAETVFAESDAGRIVSERVAHYRSGEASDLVAGAAQRANACRGWTETDENGTVTYQLSVLPSTRPFAVRLVFDRPGPHWTEDVVAVVRGDLVAWVSYGGSQLDPDQEQAVIQHADDRLASVVETP